MYNNLNDDFDRRRSNYNYARGVEIIGHLLHYGPYITIEYE